jgi:riboflavin biosynthesis pyrimidine reductase
VPDDPAFEVLFPADLAGWFLPPADDEADLLALFDDPPPRPSTGAHVRAVMLATLDGAVTGADRRASSAGDAADRRLFAALRALADVVLVGAGTVRAEGYREVQVPAPLAATRAARGRPDRVSLAVVTRSGDLPEPVLDGDALVVTSSDAPGLGTLRERVGADRLVLADRDAPGTVDCAAAVRALAERGLRRVHAEGGPTLLAGLIAAGAIDELSLTVTPRLVAGPAPRVLDATAWLDPPPEAELVHLLRAGSTLLGRWRVP